MPPQAGQHAQALAQSAERPGGAKGGRCERWRESCCQASAPTVQPAHGERLASAARELAPELEHAPPLLLQLACTHCKGTGSRKLGAPCATIEALPALYCVILKVSCFLHLGDLQKVRVVFGAFTWW